MRFIQGEKTNSVKILRYLPVKNNSSRNAKSPENQFTLTHAFNIGDVALLIDALSLSSSLFPIFIFGNTFLLENLEF